jgi:hypothetical protein
MFFTYTQNNSFGKFVGFKAVVVEADSAAEADKIAENSGEVYFDGVSKEIDCECCGDRWWRQFSDEGTETPEVFGEAAFESDECLIIKKLA